MAEIVRTPKALTVNPLKASQPIGAALAFLGVRNSLPMLHGAQGCTAFGKVFLVRHFREPIPLQTPMNTRNQATASETTKCGCRGPKEKSSRE